jgi:hypothetical protein
MDRVRRHRAWTAFFGVFGGLMAGFGIAAFARGYLAWGLTAFTGTGLTAVIGAFVRMNWRILDLNRDLLEQNRQLRGRIAELMRRLHERDWG